MLQPAQRYREGNQSSQFLFCHQKTNYMTQTFESLLVEIQDSLTRVASPTDLTLALSNALQKAEAYEEEWINDLYERSEDNFKDFIY